MNELNTEEKSNVQKNETNDRRHLESKIPLIFLGILIISIISHLIFNYHWAEIIFNHLAGLGIVGLMACLAAFIAKKKAQNYRKAFLITFFLPIILGVIAVVLVFYLTGFKYCGGGVILAAGIVIVIYYSLVKKRKK